MAAEKLTTVVSKLVIAETFCWELGKMVEPTEETKKKQQEDVEEESVEKVEENKGETQEQQVELKEEKVEEVLEGEKIELTIKKN